jgi:hypothetical protein
VYSNWRARQGALSIKQALSSDQLIEVVGEELDSEDKEANIALKKAIKGNELEAE